MRKYVKSICGALTAAMLAGTAAKWPVQPVSAEETQDVSTQGTGDTGSAAAEKQPDGADSGTVGTQPGDADSGTVGTQPGDADSGTSGTQPGGSDFVAGDAQSGSAGSGEEQKQPGDADSAAAGTQPGDADSGTSGTQPGGSDFVAGDAQSGSAGSGEEQKQPGDEDSTVSGTQPGDSDSGAAGTQSGDAAPEDAQQGYSWKRTTGAMDEETALWIEEAGEALAQIASQRDIMALVYLSDEYPIRSLPSMESGVEATVLSGQTVDIQDVYVDDEIQIWYYVKLDRPQGALYGYVPRTYLACADARFLEWEAEYGMNADASTYTVDVEGQALYPDIEQFPESYRPALLELKKRHPNWTFAKMNTTLDWQTSIDKELQGGKSLVYKTLPDWAKNGLYDTGNWYYASRAALEMYMDPRNSLTENAIFQFEQLTYNEAYHTLDAVTKFLKNTFMTDNDGKLAPGTGTTYANLFWEIGREEGRKVSPFHLAARVLQEQGAGTSPLISGTYPGFEGLYNYFNIGATGRTDEQVITSGLTYARDHGWNNVDKALRGGADFISANYIKRAQDTLYLQKFNVNPPGTPNAYATYTHQYMQNITAPTTEGLSIKRLYEGAGALDNTFVFKIPVYENMPGEPGGIPSVSTEVVLALPEGYGDSVIWLDGVAYEGQSREGGLAVTAPDVNARTAVVYRYNENGVPVGMYVWSLSHNGTVYTATAQPGIQDLLTYHGFSIRVTGKTGIRFKTGISAELRGRLLSQGVDGYTLKEYGTLVTSKANLGQYPMIKGGTKIAGGISYGRNADGVMQDVIFETVEGRHRFTSVLVGIPVEQYKTEFAFRGYAVLEKHGVETIVYGPVVARSIYSLAQQLIGQGVYENGSEADAFLKKLVGDADALTVPAQ